MRVLRDEAATEVGHIADGVERAARLGKRQIGKHGSVEERPLDDVVLHRGGMAVATPRLRPDRLHLAHFGEKALGPLGRLRAFLKIPRGAVFAEKAGWRGATMENTPRGSSTEEQRSQPALCAKTLRAAGLLSFASVGSVVTARCGDAPLPVRLGPRRLGQSQNPSPQHPLQFSDRLLGRPRTGTSYRRTG